MENLQTGGLGEDIACKFLERKGYKILERNYRKKFGEIDIVAEKEGAINFIEVKTAIKSLGSQGKGEWQSEPPRPEEKVDQRKLKRIGRAVRVYLEERSIKSDWQFKVLSVVFDPNRKEARVKVIEDVIPE